jgi:hypothetical protein
MKADTKPTIEEVAALLCKGATPDWAVQELHKWVDLIASSRTEAHGDEIDRLMLESALNLQFLLPLYTVRVYEMIGEEYPTCIDDVDQGLVELIPILTEGLENPKRGKKPDLSRHLCAAVCREIWGKVHGKPQPHSPKLWEACEAYWVACGRPAYPSRHIKNWEDYLLKPPNCPRNS